MNLSSLRINILALLGAFIGLISLFAPWIITNYVWYGSGERWVFGTENHYFFDFVNSYDWNFFMIFFGILLSAGSTLSVIILVPGLAIFFILSQGLGFSGGFVSLGAGFYMSCIAAIMILFSIFRPIGPGYKKDCKPDLLGRILTLSNGRHEMKVREESSGKNSNTTEDTMLMRIPRRDVVLKKWNLIGILFVVLVLVISIVLSTQPTSQIRIHGIYHIEGTVIVSIYFDGVHITTQDITSSESFDEFDIILNVVMGRHWYGIDHSIELNGTEYRSTGNIDGLIDYHEIVSIGPLSKRMILLTYNAGLV